MYSVELGKNHKKSQSSFIYVVTQGTINLLNGIFKCIDKHCKICSLYIVEGHSFIMSYNMRYKLRSHVTCKSINIIYYLKCNMCKKKETYI